MPFPGQSLITELLKPQSVSPGTYERVPSPVLCEHNIMTGISSVTIRQCKGESRPCLTVDVSDKSFVIVRGIMFVKHISGKYFYNFRS